MNKSISILCLVCLFLLSCGRPDYDDEIGAAYLEATGKTGLIYGVVTDMATGESVIGAGVELQPVGLTTFTGSDGMFEFNELAIGTYTLYVTKTGYSDRSIDITVESGKQLRVDVQLEKLSDALMILDNEGNEIAGLYFGIADVSRQFNIFNGGSENLEWEISFSAGWIESVSKESGELKAGGTQGVIVNIDRSKLESGENVTMMYVTSSNGNKQLTVEATNATEETDTEPTNDDEDPVPDDSDSETKPDDDTDADMSDTTDTTDTSDTVDTTDTTDTADTTDTDEPSSYSGVALGNICTGQDKCYNASSVMEECPASEEDFFGQDAQYTSKCTAQSFSSTSNVVIDNNTGLTWEKSPSENTYTWDNASNHCNELNSSNYGGIKTWRVPNPLELLTIVDNSKYNPATNSNFTNMPSDDSVLFWTSAEYKGNTSCAYAFNPYSGYCYYSDPYLKTKTYKVLCVSGDEMQPATSANFMTQTISGKVVVTDSKTGLMWQKEYAILKTWQQALKYCEDLTYAGYSDWRLPNKNELSSLINYEKSGSPSSYFPDMPDSFFWSSSTYVGNANNAWSVDFSNGGVYNHSKTHSSDVRCVR